MFSILQECKHGSESYLRVSVFFSRGRSTAELVSVGIVGEKMTDLSNAKWADVESGAVDEDATANSVT
jgi:hypothetical protein